MKREKVDYRSAMWGGGLGGAIKANLGSTETRQPYEDSLLGLVYMKLVNTLNMKEEEGEEQYFVIKDAAAG